MRNKRRINDFPPVLNGAVEESARCPLCQNAGTPFYHNRRQYFYRCVVCCGIFAHPNVLPDQVSEYNRYKEHNNDINDPRYRQFVSPITDAVMHDFTPTHSGLDFGAGPGPVISTVLHERGYTIAQYDPFFAHNPRLLEFSYDYIACCEVIEHFFYPEKDFALLKKLLKPGGKLYCMTSLYSERIDFKTWAYKNDCTHVFFYQRETLAWIQKHFGFSQLHIDNRLSVFTR